ncbi:MAG TPA: UvrD-helicase domain-containing protein [Pyrinomonadaceae bacterium]|nr:UvrD-helicase domain-containing protein [Pyrinomonadaceae bacterium]
MNDLGVAQVLRSNARLVLVEAPAGFGKTFQGCDYARNLLLDLFPGRLLVLTHTHAACDAFDSGTGNLHRRVEIRTIDSLITQIASAYHTCIGLPASVPTWAFQQGQEGFNQVAIKVARLITAAPMIAASLVERYPYVICDEHQDSSEAQHKIINSLYRAGALVRVFADPMQAIYEKPDEMGAWNRRWSNFQEMADEHVELETPHRWMTSAPELGDWVKQVRRSLRDNREINLSGELPRGLFLIRADNIAQHHERYILSTQDRHDIDSFVRRSSQLLVLATANGTVRALRAFFNRGIPIWEGHNRNALTRLFFACQQQAGNPGAIAAAFISFVQDVAVGFTDSGYGNLFRREVADSCAAKRRQKTAKIQKVARFIVDSPDHRGAARALAALSELVKTDNQFRDIRLDLSREFSESIRLAQYENIEEGLSALNLQRNIFRRPLPAKAISTVHKAKGLEKDRVLLVPCDRNHFAANEYKRRLLYVAVSRATESLAIVVPRESPSPLLKL